MDRDELLEEIFELTLLDQEYITEVLCKQLQKELPDHPGLGVIKDLGY